MLARFVENVNDGYREATNLHRALTRECLSAATVIAQYVMFSYRSGMCVSTVAMHKYVTLLMLNVAVSLYTLACTVIVELFQIDGLAVVGGERVCYGRYLLLSLVLVLLLVVVVVVVVVVMLLMLLLSLLLLLSLALLLLQGRTLVTTSVLASVVIFFLRQVGNCMHTIVGDGVDAQ